MLQIRAPYRWHFDPRSSNIRSVTDKVKSKAAESEPRPIRDIADLGLAATPAAGETRKWFKSLEYIVETILKDQTPQQAVFFLNSLTERLRSAGIKVPAAATTPYLNTLPVSEQPPYPGDWRIETRIKSIIRWNAMAMVVNANRKHDGLGGHISTYASLATLYEV